MDGRNALVLVGAHRRANNACNPVRGGWLDAERAASGLGICGKLNGVVRFADSMVAQPGAKRLRIAARGNRPRARKNSSMTAKRSRLASRFASTNGRSARVRSQTPP